MNARQQLNVVYVGWSFVIASFFGWLFNSSVLFVIALVLAVAGQLSSGNIRPGRSSSSQRRPRRR
ncbi:MAG: hypothetical protein K1X57_22335 [Gemmataceae bacterium]|nr:hypothetical protein [Gemmataceae bacterium]